MRRCRAPGSPVVAPRRAVLILELFRGTSFAVMQAFMWAARRPEQSRNVLQLTALSSLQVDCTTSFASCQGIFSASAAFPLFRGVRLASAVVLLTLSILPRVLRCVKGFSKNFSFRPSPLLPLIMYMARVCRGMGSCEFVAFATVSMVLWWCSSGM